MKKLLRDLKVGNIMFTFLHFNKKKVSDSTIFLKNIFGQIYLFYESEKSKNMILQNDTTL